MGLDSIFEKAKTSINNAIPGSAADKIKDSGVISKVKNRLEQINGTVSNVVTQKVMDQIPLPRAAKNAISTYASAYLNGGEAKDTSIDSFLSTISDFIRPNMFRVEFDHNTNINVSLEDLKAISFLCKGSSIMFPTFTEGIMSINNNNLKSVANVDKDPVSMTFMLDADRKVLRFFKAWYDAIWDPKSKQFGYKDEYVTNATVMVHSRRTDKLPILEARYINIYPTNISGFDLSWDTADTISEITVAFNYDDFEIISI